MCEYIHPFVHSKFSKWRSWCSLQSRFSIHQDRDGTATKPHHSSLQQIMRVRCYKTGKLFHLLHSISSPNWKAATLFHLVWATILNATRINTTRSGQFNSPIWSRNGEDRMLKEGIERPTEIVPNSSREKRHVWPAIQPNCRNAFCYCIHSATYHHAFKYLQSLYVYE